MRNRVKMRGVTGREHHPRYYQPPKQALTWQAGGTTGVSVVDTHCDNQLRSVQNLAKPTVRC